MKTLSDVPVKKVWQGQQAGLMRLQLYMIGRTHEILSGCAKAIKAAIVSHAGEGGKLDGLGIYRAGQDVAEEWNKAVVEWKQVFNALRWEAASIPVGTLAVLHADFFPQGMGVPNHGYADIAESRQGAAFREAENGPTFVFDPQLRSIMDAANQRIYQDGLNLSGRIWNLDRESLAGIQRELYAGVANGDSAWNIAKRVEQYLGAGRDCPRWTRTRLYSLTKKDIASGNRTGLYSGDECDSQGVAYNALRLARTEIQAIHHVATVENMKHMPWVQQEQIYLSPAHPKVDECDDVVNGGEKGDGVYPVGEIMLPIHPNCLCGRRAVMMDRDQFVDHLRGWMNGSEAWPEMDGYATWIGAGPDTRSASIAEISLAVGLAQAFVTWLWGNEKALDAAIKRNVQLGLGF